MVTPLGKFAVIPALLVLTAAGCVTTTQDRIASQLDNGIAGYTGPIDPIREKVELGVGPVHFFRFNREIYTRRLSGDEVNQSSTVEGSVRARDDGYLRERKVVQWTVNGQQIPAERPIAIIREWLDPAGNPDGQPDFSFPALESPEWFQKGGTTAVADRISDQFKESFKLEELLADYRGSYKQGDYLLAPAVYASVFRAALGGNPQTNTLGTRVIGVTQFKGYPALVARLEGFALGNSNGEQVSFTGQGHIVIDIETGIATSWLQKITGTLRDRRGAIRTNEWMDRGEITSLQRTSTVRSNLQSRKHSDGSVATDEPPNRTLDPRKFTVKWQGYADALEGVIDLGRSKQQYALRILLPGNVTCNGHASTIGRTWSVACTNGDAAGGTYVGRGDGRGATGNGIDTKGQAISFEIKPR